MVRTHTFTAATDSAVETDGGTATEGEVATRSPHVTVTVADD